MLIYDCNIIIWMEMEKSKVSIQFLLIFRQSGDVLFLYARRLGRYTATETFAGHFCFFFLAALPVSKGIFLVSDENQMFKSLRKGRFSKMVPISMRYFPETRPKLSRNLCTYLACREFLLVGNFQFCTICHFVERYFQA